MHVIRTKLNRLFFKVFLSLLVCICWPSAAEAYLVEVTFDDADDGTGPHDGHGIVNNLENNFASFGEGLITVELVGEARRSAYGEGRYGRGATFPNGEGSVRLSDWDVMSSSRVTVMMWVQARDRRAGRLLGIPGSLAVALGEGELVIEVRDEQGGASVERSGAFWPEDGEYHHLIIVFDHDQASGVTTVGLLIDWELVAELPLNLRPPASDVQVWIGDGFDGIIDELVIHDRLPGRGDRWDWMPTDCEEGFSCLEEVIDIVPREYTHLVPVRFKTVYDPTLCSATSPCPLLIDISGGGTCANNYNWPFPFAANGFVAVTVDLYCEASEDFRFFPMETSQVVAVKNHMMTDSPLRDLIEGSDYVATGCSHGCNVVTHLMAFEEEYPIRTYGRSCRLDWTPCAYAAGVLCPVPTRFMEERIVRELGALDWESPRAMASYSKTPIAQFSPELAASRELALSWGVNLTGEVCRPDGSFACYEEGMAGVTYLSRRVRDVWQYLEPTGAPTGYFVEDRGADCRHCASLDSVAFACGTCLLLHGRSGMEAACPQCVTYEHQDIGRGGAGAPCPIEASWYEDPWPSGGEDGDGDGNGDGNGDGGCGCSVLPGSASSAWFIPCLIVMALLFRRSRPFRSCPRPLARS